MTMTKITINKLCKNGTIKKIEVDFDKLPCSKCERYGHLCCIENGKIVILDPVGIKIPVEKVDDVYSSTKYAMLMEHQKSIEVNRAYDALIRVGTRIYDSKNKDAIGIFEQACVRENIKLDIQIVTTKTVKLNGIILAEGEVK